MRICDAFRGLVVLAVLGFAGHAAAFDATNISPDTPPADAFKFGFDAYKQGDKLSAFEALSFAAGKGHAMAQWKLGQMYAAGDGIERDDYKAFELFSEVADAHAEDSPTEPGARFVSNAFVQLGTYYRLGIANTLIKPDPSRARQMFTYAASYFGDPEAQLNLAKMYYRGEGGDRDPLQAARWSKLSADKGNPGGQGLLGHLLFEGDDGIARQPVSGLALLLIARQRANPSDRWIGDMQEDAFAVATEDERRSAVAYAQDWLAKNPRR
jgi:TPR repeat protein